MTAELVSLIVLVIVDGIFETRALQIIWDNEASNINTIDENNRIDVIRMPNEFLIFPGTKWCGAGNIAQNENDLGVEADTDKCCRKHDHCDEYIEGYQTKYNLTNPSFYTRLSCDCDDEFHMCLKDVNSKTSNQVGQLYFVMLGTKCFREDYPVVSCKKYSNYPVQKCVEYEYDTTNEKVYQWFDVPNY